MNARHTFKRLLIIWCLLLACARPALASAESDAPTNRIPAWPFVYHRADADHAETDILAPLFRYERTDTRTRYALRPFLFSTEADPEKDYRKTSVLWPLSIYTRQGPALNFHLFPIYWYGQTETTRYQIVAPLYWSGRSPDRRYTVLFPLYWRGTDGQNSHLHLWPLFGIDRRGAEFVNYSTFYPLFQFSRDLGRDETTINALWPFYRLQAGPDRLSHRLLPLYWYTTEADRSRGVVLNYYWNSTPTHVSRALFPLWYRMRGKELAADLILPFYYNRVDGDTRFRMITPLYMQHATPRSRLDVAIPLYLNRTDGDSRFRMITPLYIQSTSAQNRFDMVIPLFARHRTPESHLLFVAPTWLSVTGTHSRLSMLLPLYLRYRTDDTSLLITPLYLSSVTPQSATRLLLPLYFDSRSDQTAARVIFPLYLSVRSENSQLRFFTPLFLHYQTADSLFQLGLPLYFRHVGGSLSFMAIFPFYYHATDDVRRSAATYYFPLYGHYRRGDAVSRHYLLFPIYSQLRDEELQLRAWDVLWPLWHYETTPTTTAFRLLPLVWHSHTPESRTTIGFPLYWSFASGDRSATHLFPLYGVHTRGSSYTKRYILGPLFMQTIDGKKSLAQVDLLFPLISWKREGESRRIQALPLYYHQRSADRSSTVLFPLYWSFISGENRSLHLVPIYSVRTKGEWYAKRFILGPTIIQTRDDRADRRQWDVLFPLSSFKREGDVRRAWIFPLYYHRREPGAEATVGFPLYWSFQEADHRTWHLVPFYRYRRHETYREHAPLWPLLRFGRDVDQDVSLVQVLTMYHRQHGGNGLTTVFPLWWHETTPQRTIDMTPLLHRYEHDAAVGHRELSLLWLAPDVALMHYAHRPDALDHSVFPLYAYRSNAVDDSLRWSLLWPLFSYSSRGEFVQQTGFLWKFITYERKGEDTSEFRFLWRFIAHTRTAASSTFEFNPFYYRETDKDGGSYWAVLGGLVGMETSAQGTRRMRFLWIF